MKLDELTPWLFSRVTGGIRWGLERTEELLAGVDDPHRRFHSIHIAGTNGKGSVAALCDGALRAAGRGRIGLYTSPHLVSMTERVRVSGVPVEEEELAAVAERLRPAIEKTGASFFEATTAMAFMLFAEREVDIAVVEVGLGGRLDATNVLSPLVTGVTNIAIDHAEFLGNSLEEIAREKGGIFKAGVPAVSGAMGAPERRILRDCAERVGAPYAELDEICHVEHIDTSVRGTRMTVASKRWGRIGLEIPLPGRHQARNAALGLEILGLLPEALRPSAGEIVAGFGDVRWPGRLQVETIRGTTYVFDVAHNPAGAEALADALAGLALPRPVVHVVGVLSDKDWKAMLPAITRDGDAVIVTVPDSAPTGRRWDLREVEEWMGGRAGVVTRFIPDLGAALERAATLGPHGTVVVTGSVHTVGDAMKRLGVRV